MITPEQEKLLNDCIRFSRQICDFTNEHCQDPVTAAVALGMAEGRVLSALIPSGTELTPDELDELFDLMHRIREITRKYAH